MIFEALRYLGVQGKADVETFRLVSDCMEIVSACSRPNFVKKTFTPQSFKPYLIGEHIKNHIKDANKILVMAVTLGFDVDLAIKRAQAVDMRQAAALDACAAAYIEHYFDSVMPPSLTARDRFSPGYGDYPLWVQPLLLKEIKAEKIGITALASHMLLPSKSITAVMGLTEETGKREMI